MVPITLTQHHHVIPRRWRPLPEDRRPQEEKPAVLGKGNMERHYSNSIWTQKPPCSQYSTSRSQGKTGLN